MLNIVHALPAPFDSILSFALLEQVPNADLYLTLTIVALTASAFVQLHAFTRPPPVPSKLLPRRPALQILFKPDDLPQSATAAAATSSSSVASASSVAASRLGRGGGASLAAQQQQWQQRVRHNGTTPSVPAAPPPSMADSFGVTTTTPVMTGGGGSSPTSTRKDATTTAPGSPVRLEDLHGEVVEGFDGGDGYDDDGYDGNGYDDGGYDDGGGGNGQEARLDDATATTAADSSTAGGGAKSTTASQPSHANNDLPDSFAPLLSSSQMEVLHNQLTADLIHAIQVEGGIRLGEGRHEIPLDKDTSRPQFVLDVGKEGCRITAVAAVGSDRFTSAEDLDVSKPTTSRSRPMVKHAGLVLDPPLPLANVAPTLIHFPTLFEDNVVPSLRRIQIVRFALDLVATLSSFLEKVLWIIESKCQIHLSKVRVMPLYKGSSQNNSPQWRLSLSFSGHVLLFGWIPIPFIGIALPTFIIPQPHALLEYLLTAQPLASAKLKRENIAEQRIVLAALDAAESWHCNVKAVATPPALGIDLTVPGGLTVALEMMHGRDLYAGVRRQEEDASGIYRNSANNNIGMTESYSGDTLSSLATHPAERGDHLRNRRAAFSPGGGHSLIAAAPPPEPFDANTLVPWFVDVAVKGRIDEDKISLSVTRLSARHESAAGKDVSQMSVSGSVIISKADPSAVASGTGPVAVAALAHARKMPSSSHLAALNATSDSPSVCEVLLFPDTSSSTSMSQRLKHLLKYDYAFDIGDDTQLDAVSLSVGATHPMLKGGTIITTVLESIYAFGSLTAREGAIFDTMEKKRKRNILRHLPAVDFTAGIQNIFIPEQSMSISDDGQTKCFPELKGGRMMIRVVGGFMANSDEMLNVAEGIKVVADFGVSSFALNNETNVNEFPELDILDGSSLVSLLSGTFSGRICCYLRPQRLDSTPSTGTAPNVFNPLEAYEIEFSGSSVSLKIKEGTATLGHRRVIIPTETSFLVKIVESLVDMTFEGKTAAEVSWDFQGSSPILQVTDVGHSPANATHENREQVELLISDLRQGRLNLQVSPVGGIAFKKAATSREDREGLYDWKFFNAIIAPDDESPQRLMDVVHDKRTMQKLLQVMKMINSDLEKILHFVLTRVWRAKDIFEEEGISDPGKLIPGHRMARLVSLFLCGDVSQVGDILPIIRRVVAGEGLDVVKVKELLRKNVSSYDDWAPEMDRMVRWIDVMLSPMDAPRPYIENEVPPLSEMPCHSSLFDGIPSAKEVYSTLLDKQQLSLDPSFSNLVGRIAPYMSFPMVEYVLTSREHPSDWQPSDLRRLRYVYSVKKKVLDISESYGGLSFLPQSFFVSIFLGEATRASLRASIWSHKQQQRKEAASWAQGKKRRGSTLSKLRRQRMLAPQSSNFYERESGQIGSAEQLNDEDTLSPAGRVASMGNIQAQKKKARIRYRAPTDVTESDADNRSHCYELGDSLLGPHDVAILLQAGLTSSMKGSTVVQLNQRMLLDLIASQPKSFAVAVLAEIGTPGGQGSPRGLTSALMALLELDQSSFTRFHRLDMHALLESWLPGFKIPRREDYLAGGRWARQSYYDSLFGVAKNLLEDAEPYMALKGHVQRVRHNVETDPLPQPKELTSAADNVGIDLDSSGHSDFHDKHTTKLMDAIDKAKERIGAADHQGHCAMHDLRGNSNSVDDIETCRAAVALYRESFEACAAVLKMDKLSFQADWFKHFYRRNYDALMVKSVYDNILADTDRVREWMDALRKGDLMLKKKSKHHDSESVDIDDDATLLTPPSSPNRSFQPKSPFSPGHVSYSLSGDVFFMKPEDHSEQELLDGIIDALFYYEEERETIRADPLVRLLIANPPGKYNFSIVTAFGVITEGEKGSELAEATKRLEEQRGVRTIRSDTGTARSFEFNASKIEEAIERAVELKTPFGLLGYSQGCANALTAESLMLSGSPYQQQTITSPNGGLVCRQMLFSAANGSMHGPASDMKGQRLIVMCEEFFKYQQGYCSRAFISTVLELINNSMDSASFQKFIGGAQSLLPDGSRAFWREAQHLPYVPTTVLRGVLEEHTTPESLDMISNLLTKQAGSALHDSQVHVFDAVGHPVYTTNRNGKILENSDMGGSVQRTHHWSPLCEEVEYVKTKRDVERASFECAKDRHIFPWVDVNARFGIIEYAKESDGKSETSPSSRRQISKGSWIDL